MKDFNFSRPWLVLIAALAFVISACGGGSSPEDGGDSSSGVTTNTSSVQLEKIIDERGNTLSSNSIEVTSTFTGDGIVVGFAPGVTPPDWLDITEVSTTTDSAVFEFSPFYHGYTAPGVYTTDVRFVTGKLDGTVIGYTDVNITFTLSEYFGVSIEKSVQVPVAPTSTALDLSTELTIKDNITGLPVVGNYDWELVSSSEPWLNLTQNSGNTSSAQPFPVAQINKTILLENPGGEQYSAELTIATNSEKYGRDEHTIKVSAFIQIPHVSISNSTANRINHFIEDAKVSESSNILVTFNDSDKRVNLTDLTSGKTFGYYPFNDSVKAISVSPNGKYLYVTTYSDDFYGYLSVIDLSSELMINKFKLNDSSYYDTEVIGNDYGEAFVKGHSSVNKYNTFTGELLASGGTSTSLISTLAADQSSIYSIAKNSYNNALFHIFTNPSDNTDLGARTLEVADYQGLNLWADTTNNMLLTGYGYVFNADNFNYVKRIINEGEFIRDATFDSVNNQMLVVEQYSIGYTPNNSNSSSASTAGLRLVSYELPSFNTKEVIIADAYDIRFIFSLSGETLLIERHDSHYLLKKL